ncbi:transposase [Desulfosporosinus sp. BICA1-9]|uniref:transposase n=1 Tax=Desulfosporosinus sp. BICA1-9 TaxID=1531958 RepID=UPI00054C39EB|nr:transposase [Desulfosporosinus sp. BICA1-9]KJS48046.1 MAG: hypothetical protein VR66_16200 [Peptococcaceae bacterium BRH_c23]KJS87666.1 MAG: hypothetical protein JL57_13495 [Desulfosporosinus sp. BICA1-9]HBW37258.1 hypothetical protein [Desulfosporosinus sp.]
MKKRVFSAEFKAERVLEVLRGEKEINEIASAHEIFNLILGSHKCYYVKYLEHLELKKHKNQA